MNIMSPRARPGNEDGTDPRLDTRYHEILWLASSWTEDERVAFIEVARLLNRGLLSLEDLYMLIRTRPALAHPRFSPIPATHADGVGNSHGAGMLPSVDISHPQPDFDVDEFFRSLTTVLPHNSSYQHSPFFNNAVPTPHVRDTSSVAFPTSPVVSSASLDSYCGPGHDAYQQTFRQPVSASPKTSICSYTSLQPCRTAPRLHSLSHRRPMPTWAGVRKGEIGSVVAAPSATAGSHPNGGGNQNPPQDLPSSSCATNAGKRHTMNTKKEKRLGIMRLSKTPSTVSSSMSFSPLFILCSHLHPSLFSVIFLLKGSLVRRDHVLCSY
ncbi:hypothetical protein B0H12DRAFT_331636 [Mycena haematopus]|nr:hypothetical protein B0H12DRAFT_331636 [Mycena haematopus]